MNFTSRIGFCLTSLLPLAFLLTACPESAPTGRGGRAGEDSSNAGNGGDSASAGNSGADSNSGGSSGSAGKGSTAGAAGKSKTSGGSGSSGASGVSTGGRDGKGGSAGTSASSGGRANMGGTSNNNTTDGGTAGLGGAAGSGDTPKEAGPPKVNYELDPPDQCHDQDFIQGDSYKKTGCVAGDSSSQCGGKCKVFSACDQASTSEGDATFMCPRNLLFSAEFEQAVQDDGLDGFHYAVVGHDQDVGGIDGPDNKIPCCQCYQLVYAYPSPNNDNQCLVDPNQKTNPKSAIPVPPPLIVQSFNTAATTTTFDVYMPAGGMGARNGCFPLDSSSGSRKFMYSSYPLDGQPGNGGVKPASLWSECKNATQWVTAESLSSDTCTKKIADACGKLASDIPGLTDQARSACIKANSFESTDPTVSGPNDTFYHLNWSVYAMRVECPEHLTRVTGCKLATQSGVKPVKKDVKTAAQAAKDPDFWSKTASTSNLYETTTMEDCCRPTCSSYTQISQRGYATDPKYRAFYSCDVNGKIYTQAQ